MASRPPQDRRANIAAVRLAVGGKDITGDVWPRLRGLTLTDKRGGEADQLDIILDDGDGRLALPSKGAIVTLQLGWAHGTDVRPGLIDKGRFTVDEVEWGGPPDEIVIRARSADLTSGFRVRRERSHRQTTLGAIAAKVAAANGLEAKVAPELAGIAVPIVAQNQRSDMALLRQLGRRHDAVATVKDRKLILSPIGKGAASTGKPLAAVRFARADVGDYRYREVERDAAAGVEATWHDQDSGERKRVKAGGGQGAPKRLRKIYATEADAKAAANAAAGRARRAEAEFDCALPLGRPDLLPEQSVELVGFKPQADARKWLIVELVHTLDGSGGFSTKLKLETKG